MIEVGKACREIQLDPSNDDAFRHQLIHGHIAWQRGVIAQRLCGIHFGDLLNQITRFISESIVFSGVSPKFFC